MRAQSMRGIDQIREPAAEAPTRHLVGRDVGGVDGVRVDQLGALIVQDCSGLDPA